MLRLIGKNNSAVGSQKAAITNRHPRFQNTVQSTSLSLRSSSLPSRSFSVNKEGENAVKLLQIGQLNHVAIAVSDLEESVKLYRDILGAKVSAPEDLPEHGVTTVFINLGNTKLELLKPLGNNSPIQNFLDKKPSGGIHHICIEVDDINFALKHVQEKGIKSIDAKPKIGAHGKPVVFLHPKSMNGVLVELEQK